MNNQVLSTYFKLSCGVLLLFCLSACGGNKPESAPNPNTATFKATKPGLGLYHNGQKFDARQTVFTLNDTLTFECSGGAPLDYEFGSMRFLIPVPPSSSNNQFGLLPQHSIAVPVEEVMLSYTDSSLQVKVPLKKLENYRPLKRIATNDTTQVFVEVDRVFQLMAGEGPAKIDVGFNKLELLVALRIQE